MCGELESAQDPGKVPDYDDQPARPAIRDGREALEVLRGVWKLPQQSDQPPTSR